jgi:hypothetical protein
MILLKRLLRLIQGGDPKLTGQEANDRALIDATDIIKEQGDPEAFQGTVQKSRAKFDTEISGQTDS